MLVCKTMHGLPTIIDPVFNANFNEKAHVLYFQKRFFLNQLEPKVLSHLKYLLINYRSIFDLEGLRRPVVGYNCSINTGRSKPVTTKGFQYGNQEHHNE